MLVKIIIIKTGKYCSGKETIYVSSDYLHREIIMPHYKIVYKIPLSMASWNCMSYKQTLGGCTGLTLQSWKMKFVDYKYTKE